MSSLAIAAGGDDVQADRHPRQDERLASLWSYGILDTEREADFDDIVELASQVCGTPISVVNLIDRDRQWFKAEVGLGVRETPIESSICAHAILETDFVEIRDTLVDPRMAGNAGRRRSRPALLRRGPAGRSGGAAAWNALRAGLPATAADRPADPRGLAPDASTNGLGTKDMASLATQLSGQLTVARGGPGHMVELTLSPTAF